MLKMVSEEEDVRIGEIWKVIPIYEDYEVSNLGRVRHRYKDFILTIQVRKDNYCFVHLNRKKKTLHSLVMLAFIGPRPRFYQINHKDLNPSNNCLDNLEYVTQSENMLHMYKHSNIILDRKGEKNNRAKLTEIQVLDIYKNKGIIPKKELAKKYNVSIYAIYNIWEGISWKHLLMKSV